MSPTFLHCDLILQLPVISSLWRGTFKLCKYSLSHQIFNVFTYLLLWVWIHGFWFYSRDYNPLFSLLILMFTLPHIQSVWVPSTWLCVWLILPISFLDQFFTFGHKKMFQNHTVLSLSWPGICCFSRKPWFLLVKSRSTASCQPLQGVPELQTAVLPKVTLHPRQPVKASMQVWKA